MWSHLGVFFPPSWVPDLCCGRRVFPILHIDSNNFSDLPLGFVYICNSAYGGYDHHLIMSKIIIILSLIHSENVLEKAARNAQEESTRPQQWLQIMLQIMSQKYFNRNI